MSFGKTLTVYLAADVSKFSKNLRDAQGGLSGFGQGLLIAGAAAGAFAASLAIDGVKAAIEEEAALTKLNTTLSNLGFAAASESVNAYIDDMQMATGVADDELRPAFDRLVRSTKDVDEAQRVLSIAMDASAGTGKSLQTVADALGKAYDGNTTALGRLGIGIDKATLQSGDLELITGRLASVFAGQAEKAAGTYQGQINRLSVGFDELKESFGVGFLNALANTNDETQNLMDTMQDLQPIVEGIGQTLGENGSAALYLTSKVINLVKSVENLGQDTADTKDEFVAFGVTLDRNKSLIVNLQTFVQALSGDVEGLGVRAFNTGGHLKRMAGAAAESTQPVYDSGIAALKAAEHTERLTKILGHAPGVYEETETKARSYGKSVEETNPKIEAQTKVIENLIGKLGNEVTALNDAKRARDDYANSLSSSILGGVSLKDVFNPDDVQGSIAKFSEAISGAAGFSDALAALGTNLPNTPGAQTFISQILGLGATSGQAFLAGLTPEVANNLVSQLDAATSTVNGNSFLLANKFYGEGIEAANQTVNGYIVQIAKEEKRLRQIGKNIGKPIGANIKAEIADAVAEAVKAAEAAKTAAAAEKAAEAANKNVTVTEQQVAKALQQLIVNADKRSTGQVGVIQ